MNDRPAQYDTLRTILFILGGLVAFMWFVELFDAVAPIQLDSYGIRPRTLEGLRNVALPLPARRFRPFAGKHGTLFDPRLPGTDARIAPLSDRDSVNHHHRWSGYLADRPHQFSPFRRKYFDFGYLGYLLLNGVLNAARARLPWLSSSY